jgi:hypothetical protein
MIENRLNSVGTELIRMFYQVSLGARTPESQAHAQVVKWIQAQLKKVIGKLNYKNSTVWVIG